MMARPRRVEADFWDRLTRTAHGCWEWTGARDQNGYGNLRIAGLWYKAHRYAYELTHGPVPDGMKVCHRCNNPPCCRPDHLWLGTDRFPRRKPPRWPASGNAVRLDTMQRQERIAQIQREFLAHDDVKHNDRLKALAYEAMALAELSRRELGEARPG